jgi:hypothetical protein
MALFPLLSDLFSVANKVNPPDPQAEKRCLAKASPVHGAVNWSTATHHVEYMEDAIRNSK